jgi:hypothetical protein
VPLPDPLVCGEEWQGQEKEQETVEILCLPFFPVFSLITFLNKKNGKSAGFSENRC